MGLVFATCGLKIPLEANFILPPGEGEGITLKIYVLLLGKQKEA